MIVPTYLKVRSYVTAFFMVWCDMVEKHSTYIVDAFTSERFAGNQAAVCLIPRVLRDEEYRKIAAEFNLSETAFPIPTNGDFKTASTFTLRWFTPTTEVPLCGHATLATSHVLFNEI
ncbi:phenazine biosynthesis-like protein, partial [Ancylostoma duodenale]